MTVAEALDALRDARVALYSAAQAREQLVALRRLSPARAEECARLIDERRAAVDACIAEVQRLLIEGAEPAPPGLIVPDNPPEP